MNSSNKNLAVFVQSLWLTLILGIVLSITFAFYVDSEKEIDRANDLRIQSHLLAEELRQSSEDLTRMVRNYVITGDPLYKQHFQEILDIRNGVKPRPFDYTNVYWDLVGPDDKRPRPYSSQTIPLLELMRQAGFTEAEFAKLSEAKNNSDALAQTEHDAIKLVESTRPMTDENRHRASEMLYGKTYDRAKYSIMKPISEFNAMMDARTEHSVRASEKTAARIRFLFIAFGFILLFMLWRIYRAMHSILGGPITEVHSHIALIGSGEFTTAIPVAPGMENSVLGWLSATQIKLAETDAKRSEAEKNNTRLKHLYAALSQCNQAIVRCTDEKELFAAICQDAVTSGGMKMAWIGLADEHKQQLRIVAYAGNGTEYLEGFSISIDPADSTSHGPTGLAFIQDHPVWCQDFIQDPDTALWHERGLAFGWGASAALPLHRNGVPIGVFTLYAENINAFDEIVQNLLLEMTTDIDYALDNFEREKNRKKTENELLKLSQAIEQSSNIIIITDYKANIEYVNAAFVATTGYTQAEVIGKNPRFLHSGKTPRGAYDDMWAHVLKGETWSGEFINQRKDGSEYSYSINISPVFDDNRRISNYIAIEEDITEKKEREHHIHYLANFDPLTGLPNRRQLKDHFDYMLALAKRNNRSFAVMFLDLDHFKEINDSLGHSYGDALLIELAKRLQAALREEDTLSRLGGDEFILLLPDIDAQGAGRVALKLQNIISKPFLIEQHELTVTASIGISVFPRDGSDMEILSKNADAAMYRAKQEGRNGYFFFTEDMQTISRRNLQLSNALHHALIRNELHVVYQPQISLKTGKIIGAEALVRWSHPDFGTISPAEFVPVAENNGLILPIGEWVLRTATAQLKQWINLSHSPIIMAVNLSSVQFRHPNLPDLVTQILDETSLPPEYLELELTEGVAMNNPESAISIMNNLHGRGIRMSIDDFGTGYSSLSYLKQFKVYKLKIDQSFVRDISIDPEDKAIVSAIINMAHSLGLYTIAEGVETIGQVEYLREKGCDEVQGYYYSRPLTAEQFEEFLVKNNR